MLKGAQENPALDKARKTPVASCAVFWVSATVASPGSRGGKACEHGAAWAVARRELLRDE